MSLIWRKASFLLMIPSLGSLVHLACLKKHAGFGKGFIDVQPSVAYVRCSVHMHPDKRMGSQLDAFGMHPSCCARIYQLHGALPVRSELGCLSHCCFSWPPPLSTGKKVICLALLGSKTNRGKSAVLAGSQQPWSGNPVMSSEAVPAGRRVPSMYFDTGSMWFCGKELIYSGLQRGEVVMLPIDARLPAGSRETMHGVSTLFWCSPVFSPEVQQSSNAHYWSNVGEFSMKLVTFTFFWDLCKLLILWKTDSLSYIRTYFTALLLMCVRAAR